MQLSAAERTALQILIDSLNGDGYLEDSSKTSPPACCRARDEDAAESREELLDHLRIALRWLQSMDPAGIGVATCPSACACGWPHPGQRPERELAAATIARSHLD